MVIISLESSQAGCIREAKEVIRMVKILCPTCNTEGYLQKVGRAYFRIRHYRGINKETNKSEFYYHPITKMYAEKALSEIKPKSNQNLSIGHLNTDHYNIDLNKAENSLDSQSKCGRSLVWSRTSA
jgi:hypothetical protein